MQRAVAREALDRDYVRTIDLRGQHGARFHAETVHVHEAGAALARVAADVRARELQMLPQILDEQCPGFDLGGCRVAVHRHAYSNRHGLIPPSDSTSDEPRARNYYLGSSPAMSLGASRVTAASRMLSARAPLDFF